ncbi:MAG: hypothetical protein P8170_18675 [Gemmatimonadota bacterium]|jgi:hypothetical protein
MRFAVWIPGAAVVAALLAGPAPSTAQGTDPATVDATSRGGWAFGASGMVARWQDEEDPFEWIGGPALEAAWVPRAGLGFDARAGYLVRTGSYGMTGVWAHATATYSVPAGRHLMQLEGGASGFLAGDSDGTHGIAGGPLVGAGVLLRPRGRLGLRLGGFMQVLVASGEWTAAPGLTTAILLLPGAR